MVKQTDYLVCIRYIEENHAYKAASREAQKARFSRNRGPPQDMAMYWGTVDLFSFEFRLLIPIATGYKFETLSLLNKPWGETTREEIEGREDDVVDNYAQYCSICKTEIGGASMVIGGEVDGGMEQSLAFSRTELI